MLEANDCQSDERVQCRVDGKDEGSGTCSSADGGGGASSSANVEKLPPKKERNNTTKIVDYFDSSPLSSISNAGLDTLFANSDQTR